MNVLNQKKWWVAGVFLVALNSSFAHTHGNTVTVVTPLGQGTTASVHTVQPARTTVSVPTVVVRPQATVVTPSVTPVVPVIAPPMAPVMQTPTQVVMPQVVTPQAVVVQGQPAPIFAAPQATRIWEEGHWVMDGYQQIWVPGRWVSVTPSSYRSSERYERHEHHHHHDHDRYDSRNSYYR